MPVTYDPLLAKLTVHAENRAAAIDRAVAALRRYAILGIRTNVSFLLRVVRHPAFRSGDLHTGFIDEHLITLIAQADPAPGVIAAAAVAGNAGLSSAAATGRSEAGSSGDPWRSLQGWGR